MTYEQSYLRQCGNVSAEVGLSLCFNTIVQKLTFSQN